MGLSQIEYFPCRLSSPSFYKKQLVQDVKRMIVLFILLPAGIAVVGIIIVTIYGVLDCLDYFCYKEEHEQSTERERLVEICVVP